MSSSQTESATEIDLHAQAQERRSRAGRLIAALLAPLDKKLLRDLWAIRTQAIAIALVIAGGISVQVMANGMVNSLTETRLAYYERYFFADLFAPVVRAPEAVAGDIAALPGVQAVETRIKSGAILDVPGMAEPVTGEILSLPGTGTPLVNDIYLVSGRRPERGSPDEAVILEAFALAHGLGLGDSLSAILNGVKRELTIVGIALSPEYVYAIAPGQIVPDDRRFGVIWMGREALAAAYDLDGAFNEIDLRLMRGANSQAVKDSLDQILKPYGAVGAYGRDEQVSDEFLSSELDQLETMSNILPPIFLAVAAFLLNVVVSRLIATEREQIGLMKAFGYSGYAVAWHYLKFVGLIGVLGIIFGMGLGVYMGRLVAGVYQEYYSFPFLIFEAGTQVYVVSTLITLGAVGAGAAWAVRRAARLDPAVAMRPPAPPDYSKTQGGWLDSKRIDQQSRMVLRQLLRFPVRGGLTSLGIALSMALLIGTIYFMDSVRHMIDVTFNVIERQDMTVTFVEPRSNAAQFALAGAPGVEAIEPFRAVDARLINGVRSERRAIVGLERGAQLSRLIDENLNAVPPPTEGLAVSDQLAKLLNVKQGDMVRVEVMEGRQPVFTVPVSQVVKTYLGSPVNMEIGALNRLMQEGPIISGAYLLVDEAQEDRLYTELKSMPIVGGVGLQTAAQREFNDLMDQTMGTAIFIYSLFAGMIAVGVVYNSVRISLSERERELASLRVLGFTRGEVSYILLGEIALLTLIALPVGALLGTLLATFFSAAMSSDLFRIPLIIKDHTYGYAVALIIGVALVSGLIVRRRIDRLDLVEVLKTRE